MPAAEYAHMKGMKVVLNLSPIPSFDIGSISYVDYLIVNDVEAEKLLGLHHSILNDIRSACDGLKYKYNVENIIITLGESGYAGLEGDNYFQGSNIKVSPIVDTSGAGDGFLSAMVVQLHNGKNLMDACEWANKYAARVVTVEGTLKGYSTVEELEQFYRTRGESLE